VIIANLFGDDYCLPGNIFLIALIFHLSLSETIMKVLHILLGEPSAFCISYLQSTMALDEVKSRTFSMVSVLVPGLAAELFNIPCTEERMSFLHSPVDTS
jgi:hypothetical protein